MKTPLANALLGLVATLAACHAVPIARQPAPSALAALFGPVVGNEVIGGRADDERNGVWLMVGGAALVHVDLDARRERRTAIKVGPGESCWGLARLQDGSLWTLKGRHAVIRIDPDGAVTREIRLADAHLGLFGGGDRLVYQPAGFTPPGPALRAGIPGEPVVSWSGITTRTFPALTHASGVALNMVACGGSAGAEQPCWFPDEAALSLVDASGRTRRLELAGLEVVAPEILLTSDKPARPIRDAYVDAGGLVWVLSSGTPPRGAPELPGGWVLARYDSSGRLLDRVALAEPVRLILRAQPGRAQVLTGAGMVAEIVQ